MQKGPLRPRERARAWTHRPSPLAGDGYRMWRRRTLFSSPLGERRDPSHQRWEGEGELPPLRLLQETTQERRVPLTLPRLRRGSLPLPDGARG
jgi:hypothetical protein